MRILSLAVAVTLLTACNRDNQDRLGDDELAGDGAAVAETAGDPRCTAAATHLAIKRELFRRAAEIRGSNAANYARIAEFAGLTVEGAAPTAPASEKQAVECRANALLRLPPNLSVAGGRTTLSGPIGFSVGRTSGTQPVVSMTADDKITIPLATLTQQRRAAPAPTPAPPAPVDPLAPTRAAPPPPPPEPSVPATAAARPSFACGRARTRSEHAVCANASLAALDRTMAAQYGSALAAATPGQSSLLQQTRDRFLQYRERCDSDSCIASTYRGRMREIDDIMADRWRGQR